MITFEPNKKEKPSVDEESEIEVGITKAGAPVNNIVEAAEEAEKKAEKEAKKDAENKTKTKEVKTEIKEKIENVFSMDENTTLFHKGSLRNGRSMEYDGSIVILGDVNAGAQVRAKGNILVLGSIRGTVHAGCTGSRDAFVFALNMMPVQLRIGDIITRFPEESKKTGIYPEYAYVEDGIIYVSEF